MGEGDDGEAAAERCKAGVERGAAAERPARSATATVARRGAAAPAAAEPGTDWSARADAASPGRIAADRLSGADTARHRLAARANHHAAGRRADAAAAARHAAPGQQRSAAATLAARRAGPATPVHRPATLDQARH